jgi:hypothetical protein
MVSEHHMYDSTKENQVDSSWFEGNHVHTSKLMPPYMNLESVNNHSISPLILSEVPLKP